MFATKQQILTPGGLNLLAAADLTPPTDSIALKNFRSDGSGVLRTRLSNSSIGVNFAGYVHTIYRATTERYFGVGTELYRGTTLVTFGFDGSPLSILSQNGYVWVMNRAKQGTVKDFSGTPVFLPWLSAPPNFLNTMVTAAAGGSLVDGVTYKYYTTWVQDDGSETNPSEPQEFTPGSGNNTAHIDLGLTASDVRTTHWNLYRIGNTLTDVYRVNPDPIALGDYFPDTGGDDMSDFNVTLLGLAMEVDHDTVPPARIIAGPYYGRMLAAGSEAHPNRVWWTPVNQPFYWPNDNWVDCGESADEVTAIALHSGQARIYLKRSVWRLRGDPDTGSLERTNAEIGLIGMNAIASEGPRDYLQGMEGIYANDGDSVRKFSHKLDPLFRPLPLPAGADPDILPLHGDETKRAKNCLAVKNGRLYFAYTNSSGTVPNQMVVANLETGNWWAENAPSASQPAAYTALHYEGQASELLGAGPLGIIYALEYPLPETNAIPHRWTSGFYTPGARDRQTRWGDLVIEHSTKVSTYDRNLTVKLKLDDGDTADFAAGSIPVATTAAGATHRVTVLPIGTSGRGLHARNAAVLIEGDSEQEVSIFSCLLHYRIEPRDALLFDTGVIDCGDPRVKSFDLLDLSIWARGTVTWEVLTDLPGNSMTQRATGTFASTTDRTPVPISLTGCDGRLVRVRLTSSSKFWLYGARLRYSAINFYLADGNKVLDLPATALNI